MFLDNEAVARSWEILQLTRRLLAVEDSKFPKRIRNWLFLVDFMG